MPCLSDVSGLVPPKSQMQAAGECRNSRGHPAGPTLPPAAPSQAGGAERLLQLQHQTNRSFDLQKQLAGLPEAEKLLKQDISQYEDAEPPSLLFKTFSWVE